MSERLTDDDLLRAMRSPDPVPLPPAAMPRPRQAQYSLPRLRWLAVAVLVCCLLVAPQFSSVAFDDEAPWGWLLAMTGVAAAVLAIAMCMSRNRRRNHD